MDANLDRAKVLTEALPYIQQYNGKIVVINCGGVPMTDPELREAVMSDIIMLRLVGIKVVLVHGIGPEAKQSLKDAGMELQYKDGYPCVNDDALDVVQQVLCGKVNKGLVSALNQKGGKAIGLCGIDGGLLSAKTISPAYGRTGEVAKVDVTMVNSFLNQGYIPVIATVAQGADGLANVYSVSANVAAAKLAVALGAEKLIQLTDKESMLQNPDDPGAPMPELHLSKVPALIRSGAISQIMVHKVNCSVEAVRSGVKSATFLDGTVPHAILLELLSDEGIGTMLTH